MRNTSTRCNIYMLPSGRIVIRARRHALSGGLRIATGVHPQEIPAIKRLFVPGMANDRMVYEAISETLMGRASFTPERRRAIAKIYKSKIEDLRAGRPISGFMATQGVREVAA